MITKPYQEESLKWLELFWQRCKETNDVRNAYAETTRDWRGQALLYRPLAQMPDVPFVCIRIPTGGGKTLVAALAIERANRQLLFAPYSLTLWLVPTDTIRTQTLNQMRNSGTILNSTLISTLGAVTILDIDEARTIQPATLNNTNTIIVATMQSFKQEDTNRLTVYKQNGGLQPHFYGVSDPKMIGNHSLVDVIRLRRPLVVVDEAHNQGSELAFDTLARFDPSAILELTATPDRKNNPSNVLFSVSAAALWAADMIKMPLELLTRADWQGAIGDAIACLNHLQSEADAERADTNEYIRPIMLIQAERKDAERETFTPEKVKKSLVEDFKIPAGEIAISTGVLDELDGVDILSDRCAFRFIITVDKLREGWDCPFAYALCTLRPTASATAAEQILGRILRMPKAKKKTRPDLNKSYAFASTTNFQATAESLRDGLVRSGFERQETSELLHVIENKDLGELFNQPPASVTVELPELPDTSTIPAALADKIEIIPESGTITIKGKWSTAQEKALEQVFQTDKAKDAVRAALARLKKPAPPPPPKSPAEQGELFAVPLLAYRNGDLWEEFEDSHLLQGEWRLVDYSAEVSEGEFPTHMHGPTRGQLVVTELGKIKLKYFDQIEEQIAFLDPKTGWSQPELVGWLEKNIPEQSILPDELAAWLNSAITHLVTSRGFALDDLAYRKSRLRAVLEKKIQVAKITAKKSIYQQMIRKSEDFTVDDRCAVTFEQGRYDFNTRYVGATELPKHFFADIGDLKSDGEEFECAVFIATQLKGVKYWVRNTSQKATSFSLQTGTDRFYPDFIVCFDDGRILVIEYKNTRDWELSENVEKRIIGELWERRSGGKRLFIMPKGQDWDAINRKVYP
jgi:type III restriction enzyme